MRYPVFEGLNLLTPEGGSEYSISVGPDQSKCILLRSDITGYSFKMAYTAQVIWSEKALKKKCLSDGK